MGNGSFGDTLIKLGVTAAVGYGAYRGVKYLGRKANEYAHEQERQKLFEAQQQMYAHQQLLASQRRELENLVQQCQGQYNLALEKLSASDFGGAIHTFNKLLPILRQIGEPNGDLRSIYAGIYRFMGQAQLNLDDYQGTISSLNQSITYDSDNAESYALRAIAKFQSNDQGGAKSDIAIAVSLAPSDSRYQSIQSEISQAGSRNTGTQEKEVLIRLHENTVNAVLTQFQTRGPELVDVFGPILGEEVFLRVLFASQLYIVSDIEMQLLSAIPQMAATLPRTFVAYWKFKQENSLLAIYDDVLSIFGKKSPQIQKASIGSAVKALHDVESTLLALPEVKSQLATLDWIEQNAHKQAFTVASSVSNNQHQMETIVPVVARFSKSMTNAFLEVAM